jgi:hypothetical protein
MSMRDEHRTRAAQFQARALSTSDETARHHFKTMADHYLQLAELERQIDCLRCCVGYVSKRTIFHRHAGERENSGNTRRFAHAPMPAQGV